MLLNNIIGTMFPTYTVKDASGNTGTMNYGDYTSASNASPSDYTITNTSPSSTGRNYPYRRGLVFGQGTTTPTLEDYRIENHINTGLTYTGNSSSFINGVASLTQVVQNTSDTSITINEVGIFCENYNINVASLLITRTVLDTPVVLQPNDIKTFTVTIDYNKFVDNVNA